MCSLRGAGQARSRDHSGTRVPPFLILFQCQGAEELRASLGGVEPGARDPALRTCHSALALLKSGLHGSSPGFCGGNEDGGSGGKWPCQTQLLDEGESLIAPQICTSARPITGCSGKGHALLGTGRMVALPVAGGGTRGRPWWIFLELTAQTGRQDPII